MRRVWSAVVAATLMVSMLEGGILVARADYAPTPSYYLALGDSMAAGFQPGKGETRGYVGDLWRRMREQIPGLSLRNVGCAGETSGSMITGKHSPCHYVAGSQLDAAVAFLGAHSGEVAFITIDVGGNDLLYRCADGRTGLIDRTCVVDLLPRLQTRLTSIVGALAGAAPGVPIVAMTYYDPFLGLWGLVPGGRHLARVDQRAWAVFDAGLATAYGDAGAAVADVAATFRIDDFTDTVVVPGRGRIPVNVALACRWTWFCSPEFFGDPHPNRIGYMKVARTFYRELLGLSP
ncbi:MAG: SGNH/GDSL hydrolase family protein [Actinomycetota bacterium]